VLRSILSDDRGQGLAEYGLILALVSVLAVGALGTLSGGINGTLDKISSDL
jgi:pilus assembly protein Flp/PilA